jgi:anhydro-N-acetylmuramic acid kinase
LVPIGDKLLFKEYEFCVNLGGIANISFDRCEKKNDKIEFTRKAFDICHVNMVNNYLASEFYGLEFDKDSLKTKSGKEIPELTLKINKLEFF